MDFLPDDEVLDAIKRNQELRGPDGMSVEESVAQIMKHCEGILRGGFIIRPLLPELILVSHPEYKFWQKYAFRRKKSWELISSH